MDTKIPIVKMVLVAGVDFVTTSTKKKKVLMTIRIGQNIQKKGFNDYSYRPEYSKNYQRDLRKTQIHKDKDKSYRRKYKRTFEGTVTDLLCSARHRAKICDLEINIDRNWISLHLEKMKCEATGLDLTLEINENVCHSAFRPSIDRIDNKKGYIKDNCRIVSVLYNKAKSDYTDADVLKMALALTEKNK
jgi:hypothetical protein